MQVSRLLSALSAAVFGAVLTRMRGRRGRRRPGRDRPRAPGHRHGREDAAAKPLKVAEPDPEMRTLPNVVGLNLQDGQNAMQTAGFYLLDDKDATGQNRFQIYDRNWVVTEQDPAAGQEVSTDTKVTLYAKKYGE